MKKLLMIAVFAGTTFGAALSASAPASARDAFMFSFNTGDVAVAYSDGYWDHSHNWHQWRDSREAREYRARYRDHYYHDRHDHFRNAGWRDDDGDGVPNRFDDHPENPYRR